MTDLSLKNKTAKGLFWGGLSNGVQQFFGLVFGIILARILNADDYGVIGMLAIFSAIAGSIQESGFTVALINKKKIKHRDYNAVFWFNILVGSFLYLILFISAPLIAKFYNKAELISLSRFLFIGIVFSSFGIAHNALLSKEMKIKEKAMIDVFSLVISGVIGITAALFGLGYWGLAIQTTSYIVVGTILRWYFSSWRPTLKIDFRPLIQMFPFSIKLFFTQITQQISANIISVLLGKFYNETQVGFYSQGNKWTNMGCSFISNTLSGVAQPVLIQVSDQKDRQKLVLRKMIRFGSFLSLPLMGGLAFVAPEFIEITIGEKWLESVSYLQVLCIWGAFYYLSVLFTNLLLTHGKSQIYMTGIVISSILQVIVIVSISKMGIFYMIIGNTIVSFLGLFFWFYCVKKLLKIKFHEVLKDILPYFIIVTICLFVTWFITREIENIYMLFVAKVLIFYLLYLFLSKISNSVIFEEIIDFIKNKRN